MDGLDFFILKKPKNDGAVAFSTRPPPQKSSLWQAGYHNDSSMTGQQTPK
jgi:hypothetical protein